MSLTDETILKNRISEYFPSQIVHKDNFPTCSPRNACASSYCEKIPMFEKEIGKELSQFNNPHARSPTLNQPLPEALNIEIQSKHTLAQVHQFSEGIRNHMNSKFPGVRYLTEEISIRIEGRPLPDERILSIVQAEELGYGSSKTAYRVFSKGSKKIMVLVRQNKCEKFGDYWAKQEFRALERLRKANNPKLLGVFHVSYVPQKEFSALIEYGRGTLDDFSRFMVEKNYRWSDTDFIRLYFQLRGQLKELKKLNISHGDISPKNIIITKNGRFKFADYGLARILKRKGIQNIRVAGTPGFWAPEIESASKRGESTCIIDPYKADLVSIQNTVNFIMRRDHRSETIEDLLKSKFNHLRKTRKDMIQTYQSHEDEYKLNHFEQLYERFTPVQKCKYLHAIFIEYFNLEELRQWIIKKIESFRFENGRLCNVHTEEAQLAYLLRAEIHFQDGEYDDARRICKKSRELSSDRYSKLNAFVYRLEGKIETDTSFFAEAGKYHSESLKLFDDEKARLVTNEISFIIKR